MADTTDVVERLRAAGWSVAVHNDYAITVDDGETVERRQNTFWLFTHPSGVWAKGEGETDGQALLAAEEQANHRAQNHRSPSPEVGTCSCDVSYKTHGVTDPNCEYHQRKEAVASPEVGEAMIQAHAGLLNAASLLSMQRPEFAESLRKKASDLDEFITLLYRTDRPTQPRGPTHGAV